MSVRHARSSVRAGFALVLLLIVGLLAAACGNERAAAPAGQAAAASVAPTPPEPANPDVILATTTSTQDSGLLDVLAPMFEKKTGYKVKTIAVGTGAALAMAQRGEADVVLVHAPASEKKLVDEGAAINRVLVMHNDFVVVGPAEDPAKVSGTKSAREAFAKIAAAQSLFVSRGDNSGTNQAEIAIWKAANATPAGAGWYQQTGSGMGQTLGVTAERKGYTLTDRATYLANKANLGLVILVEGDPLLLNVYHVMQVNPAKFDKVNAEGAKAFSAFMVAADTQKTIGAFGVDKHGQALFFPDADKTDAQLGLP